MNAILEKYKARLVNISSRNRSLVMRKIYKKNSFDLFSLNKFEKGIHNQIIEFLVTRSLGKVRLLPSQMKYEEELVSKYKKELEDKYWADINTYLENPVTSEELEAYKKDLKAKLEKEYDEKVILVKKQAEEIPQVFSQLSYLHREINAIEKETGRYELYVGYPYVEGRFKDGTFVKAPLLLFPVRLLKEKENWLLDNIEEQYILINKVFLMAFEKYNNTTLQKELVTEFYDLSEVQIENQESLLNYLKDAGIEIKGKVGDKAEKFKEHVGKDAGSEYALGELVVQNYLVLGRFPIANNSIYNDYLALEQGMEPNRLLDKLLINTNGDNTSKKALGEDKQEIREEDFYFMSSLDYSQEKAVKSVSDSDQLVIYGPPGTGKSQTIANIISDGLSKGKKILMVSQKRAALDVIYNRISQLNSKVAIIHDAEKDKRAFYDKTAAILDAVAPKDYSMVEMQIKEKSRKIDEDIAELETLAQVLQKKRPFGLSLQQMYAKSNKISSKEDPGYEEFKTLREKRPFQGMTYDSLVAIAKDTANEIASTYYDYRKTIDENKLIAKLKDNLDSFDLQELLDKIEEQLEQGLEIKLSVTETPHAASLLEMYCQNPKGVNDASIANLAAKINGEENQNLLVKLNNGQWWNPMYWAKYSKNKSQEEANHQEYQRREGAIKDELLAVNKEIAAFTNKMSFLSKALMEEEELNLLRLIYSKAPLNEYLKEISSALNHYEEFRSLSIKLSHMTTEQERVLAYAYDNSKDKSHYEQLINMIPELSILLEISDAEKEDREGVERYKKFNLLIEEINTLMKEKQSLIPELIINKWDTKLYNTLMNNQVEEKELKRQANKKRKLWPLRKYIGQFRHILTDLYPCWLLSPETVSEIMPLEKGFFDLLIFDEASQMFVENAIPTIYRSNAIVVAGDDKQLRPTSIFMVRLDDEEEVEDIETAAALEEESLLDLAKVNYDYVHLNYHYRSRYDELINFSNYAFYNGRLEVSPNLIKLENSVEKPIERIMVQGTWVDRKNKEEAEKVVELIDKILKERKENETIGIITFNIQQKDLIDDMLEERAIKDDSFGNLYNAEINRMDGNEDISLFVKNIENVQGDERDIIIFSTAYARNEKGKVSVNFGSLSSEGGENRLNVAISRARKKIYVVTSIEPEELEVEGTKNNGPKLLKKYLQYVREVSEGDKKQGEALLYSLADVKAPEANEAANKGELAKAIYNKLTELGYEVDLGVGVSGYRLDLAIYDSKAGRYVLGIECDDTAYEGSKKARERDVHRHRYLKSRGWKVIRIWSRDWWNNWQGELERIKENL
ncbi:MAG: DUF4011 domain-containing protein [Clostridiales bacterium]|nr:DUF4011 domain-containing protein [Clostridiales bacterium]